MITYGALVQKALLAATQIEKRNAYANVEIIDLRTLAPYDWEAIRASVEKTSRVMVAHEDTLVLRLRSGDRGAHRGRIIRPVGCSGAPRGRAGYVGGLPSTAGSRDSAADRDAGCGDGKAAGLLAEMARIGRLSEYRASTSARPRRENVLPPGQNVDYITEEGVLLLQVCHI